VPSGAVVAERELSDQPARLRTHMLLTIGLCLFTLVSADGFHGGAIHPSPPGRPDRHRHRLLGGAVLRHGLTICGMTTAASIRATTLIGVTVGVGRYLRSTGATVLVIGTVVGLRIVRDQLRNRSWWREELTSVTGGGFGLERAAEPARREGTTLPGMDQQRDGGRVTLVARLPPRDHAERLGEALSRLEGVREVEWER